MTKKLTEGEAKSMYGDDFELEERRMKYGFYNNRSELAEEPEAQRKRIPDNSKNASDKSR